MTNHYQVVIFVRAIWSEELLQDTVLFQIVVEPLCPAQDSLMTMMILPIEATDVTYRIKRLRYILQVDHPIFH